MIVKLARDPIFAKFCEDAHELILRHHGRDPGLDTKAAAGQARAGPLAAALGPGPGSWAQECKKNGKDTLKYNMKYDKLN